MLLFFVVGTLNVMTPPEFLIAEELARSVRDVTVVYELDVVHDKSVNNHWADTSEAGIFKFHWDGVFQIEKVKPTPSGVWRSRASGRGGGLPSKRQELGEDPRQPPTQQMLDDSYGPCNSASSPNKLFLWSIIRYEWPTRTSVIKFLGEVEVAGVNCQVFEITLCTFSSMVFVSPERGGQALRVEVFERGELYQVLRDVELRQLTDSQGRKVWFPVKGYLDGYWLGGNRGLSNKPVGTAHIRFLPGTMKLNSGAPSETFEVSFDSRTKVRGVTPPPKVNTRDAFSPAANRDVDARAIAKAAEADAARVADRDRRPTGSSGYDPWTIGLASLAVALGLGALIVAKRRS